ncbi:hypothetical protein [Roseovarius sp. M141]|uniref:hypothetical protein n=1 Tax=Roseovarius sp. M141 TaxID=2583806 RepID=UPI0020CC0880|nr:hypothetical protein [Roseovarius sp. M141]MCQ0090626.1 hypothetical protein [Roseovarius sp. M141]
MQRAKHANRKKQTRARIMIGEAAERAGAIHLGPEEIEAVLAHYVETGGEPALKAFVSAYRRARSESDEGGSAASRRGVVSRIAASARGSGLT